MPAKREREMPAEVEPKGDEALDAVVGRQVLLALGRPPKLLRMQVKCLWPAFYRVNIFVGGDTAHATIANSFFVRTSAEGHILKADPAITMQYGRPEPADTLA